MTDFNDSHDNADLKRELKFGPKLSRQMRAEYAICMIGGDRRRLSPQTMSKLKSELVRLGQSGDRRGVKFVEEEMFRRYPGLRGA